MDATLLNEAENLRRTAERFNRAGLIVDFACLSREHRRAAFALQSTIIACPQAPQPKPTPIGFAYPNAR